MDYSNLLHDFVDGTLDKAQEDKLFMLLSSNEELRSELKQFIAMDKAFGKKLSSFAPSAKSTMGVFSALGIAAPVVETAPAVTGAAAKSGGIFTKYFTGMKGAVLSSAITALLFLGIFGNKIFSGSESSHATLAESKPPFVGPVPTYYIDKEAQNQITPQTPRVIVKYVRVPKVESNEVLAEDQQPATKVVLDNDSPDTKKPLENITLSNPFENHFQSGIDIPVSNMTYALIPMTQEFKPLISSLSFNKPFGFSVRVQGSQYWAVPKPSLEESWLPTFPNTGIALMYALGDNFSIGLDIRNEHFYQEYEGTDVNGDKLIYKQFPNYLSWSGIAKWNFASFKPVDSFIQIMAGGTKTGLTGRLMLGFEITPHPQYSFILGVEGSVLRYMHQDKAFYSPKIGLNYGVSFNF